MEAEIGCRSYKPRNSEVFLQPQEARKISSSRRILTYKLRAVGNGMVQPTS